MARLETSAIVWLALLGAGTLAIAGVGGYAAYRMIHDRPSHEEAVAVVAPTRTSTLAEARPALLTKRPTEQDAQRSADEAYRDLWVGIARGDAEIAAKYVPAAKLREMKTGEEVIDSFLGLSPIEDVRVAKATTEGNRAVLFVKASSPNITDERGRRAPIDVVVRMARDEGHWTVESQMWLVSTPPEEEQARALAWLNGR